VTIADSVFFYHTLFHNNLYSHYVLDDLDVR